MTPFADNDIIVVDLGFGDAGKGATVDYLCSPDTGLDVSAVVRFNGGAQAAHNVIVDGRHHTFSQFGAGTLSGVPTVLSQHVLVEPLALAAEARQLERLGVPNPLSLIHIDGRALVTTPFHIMMNRAKEDLRGAARHGSCGKGIGETVAFSLEFPDDALRVADCAQPNIMRRKLSALARWCASSIGRLPCIDSIMDAYTEFAAALRLSDDGDLAMLADRGRLIFEGAQGVLLDEWRGFHPHTTWSTVEPSNARAMIDELGRDAYVLGTTRTYATRHGAGPMPSERAELGIVLPELHNGAGKYQGAFRVGDLDLVMLRYGVDVCDGVDGLSVTHLDAVERGVGVVARYVGVGDRIELGPWQDLHYQQRLTDRLANVVPEVGAMSDDVDAVVRMIELAAQAPAVIVADGPERSERRVRESAQLVGRSPAA